MKFGFDLRKYNLGKFEFALDDATILTIPVPRQKDLITLQEIFNEVFSLGGVNDDGKTPEELLRDFRKIAVDGVLMIINLNSEGVAFTREEVEEKFSNGACEQFLINYIDYTRHILGK